MGFGPSAGAGRRSEINITPLVDVVLVLLIIFMVASPTVLKEEEVAVPEKSDVELAAPTAQDQVVVSVREDGQLSLNREPLPTSELTPRIRELMAARAEKVVFFDVEDGAAYGDAVHAMDLCRGAGAKVLGLMTR